ncbi:MAG: hypothetical protein AVDCRST_MAG28-1148 [uncultured Rubrobacteraceae bacterium]|uniref:Uncharacterized protein n=1 Tax=uncultured Rubrobacteraceae bacterium TaxID=349277 RepID=A0A6J4QM08_9ACTN|nr:MAG: hypothetical protein AVDCRST_MAG28-1148 [uncultured Rubrobacteraceae bacterium]
MQRGPDGWATSMRFGGQRNRYTGVYALLRAERDGEYHEQRDMFVEV